MSIKKRLKELDELLKSFRDVKERYGMIDDLPLYFKVKRERDLIASQIGKGKNK